MKTIEYKGRTIQVPRCIEELTPAQYRRYLEIYLMSQNDGDIYPWHTSKLLTLLLGERVDISMLPEECMHKAMEHYSLTEPFMQRVPAVTGQEGEGRKRFVTSTGVNLLPEWRGRKGPGAMLSGVSFGTFADCSVLVSILAKTTDESERLELMERIASMLYPQKDPGNPETDDLLTLHACLFFRNVTNMIQNDPIEVNGELISFSILFRGNNGNRRKNDRTGWTGIAMDVAESGVFGTYAQVRDTDLWDVLLFLYRKAFNN